MNLLQLNPPIPVETPLGEGLAQIIIDYSPEYSIHWVVFLRESGQCWTFTNEDIRAQRNITAGRLTPEKPERLSLKDLLRGGPSLPDSFLESDKDIKNPR